MGICDFIYTYKHLLLVLVFFFLATPKMLASLSISILCENPWSKERVSQTESTPSASDFFMRIVQK